MMPPSILSAAIIRWVVAAVSGTIVASNMDAHSVSIVDVASGATIATLQTGEGPHEVAVSHDGRRAVVSIYGNRSAVGSSLMVIDLTNPNAPPRMVELGAGNQRPHGMAFLPDDKRLLVTGERAQRVLVVDLESGIIDSSVTTGQATTHMVALTRNGTRAFTTNIAAMSVSAIDVATRSIRATFPVGARIEGIAVTPDGREVWVGGNESKKVYVLNGETGVIMHTLDGFGMAYRIGITPDGKTAVVSDPGDEKIHLVDIASHSVRRVIAVPAMAPAEGAALVAASPQGVTVSRDGKNAFVTLKAVGRVALVDIAAGSIVGTLQVGAGSDGVGYSPLVIKR
ncbi:MAG: YncE family protein [Gemmatimonadaceae bacterium]|nr:YncE family protein [Gemmatimonadaceae bacterium]